MNNATRIGIVVVLAAAVVAVVAIKQAGKDRGNPQQDKPPTDVQPTSSPKTAVQPKAALPRLVDLGGKDCVPCKVMAPILEELKKEYAGKLEVVFIDVVEGPSAGKPHGIRIIPTQIFFDASGKEHFRHEGFFSKEDILAKWKELGFDLATGTYKVPEATGFDLHDEQGGGHK